MSDTAERAGLTRRGLLAGAGAVGAGLAAASAGLLAGSAAAARAAAGARSRLMLPPGAPGDSMFFGRIFPDLAPFAEAADTVRAALLEVGAPGRIMDAGDDLTAGAKALITDPALNGNPAPASETLIGLLNADPTSYLSAHPGFTPFLGADLKLGPAPNPAITGTRTYARAHFLYYAGVLTPPPTGNTTPAPGWPRGRPASPRTTVKPRSSAVNSPAVPGLHTERSCRLGRGRDDSPYRYIWSRSVVVDD